MREMSCSWQKRITIRFCRREKACYSDKLLANPDKRALLMAVTTFGRQVAAAGEDAVGLFYFAGHGAQGRPALERDIDNYLIPLGVDLLTETDLDGEALSLSRVSATLKPAPRGAMVIILDACRNFALPASNRNGMTTRGLVEARAAPGTIIAHATSPGATATDGVAGTNGPYAKALAAQVRNAAGTRLEDVFIATRNAVLAETRNTQVPWENGSLRAAVTLGVAPVAVAPRQAPSAAEPSTLQRTVSPQLAPDARRTPSSVRAPLVASSEVSRLGDYALFRECLSCPEMVVMPGGAFLMGAAASDPDGEPNEGPQRRVTLKRFAVGRFEVTADEWDACVGAGGCSDQIVGRGRAPVARLSWLEAGIYLRWLNEQLVAASPSRGSALYRLPSEAEWEYAARAGTTTPHWTGARTSAEQANMASGGPLRSSAVGYYPSNGFGLFDVSGNVWEWVQDCYATALPQAVETGGAFDAANCATRVRKGGSWDDLDYKLRPAFRGRDSANMRLSTIGFRVARTLP